jgi:hypothetical protein
MSVALDDASQQLYQLWRSALAEGDSELADRLTVVGHALHRARTALEPDTVVPNRRDSARSVAEGSPMTDLTASPDVVRAEADLYSVDAAAADLTSPRPPSMIG